MDSSIVLCGHDLLWCTALKKEFENENIFICHADGIEDIEIYFLILIQILLSVLLKSFTILPRPFQLVVSADILQLIKLPYL